MPNNNGNILKFDIFVCVTAVDSLGVIISVHSLLAAVMFESNL